MIIQGATVPELIDQLIISIEYQQYLERTQGADAKERFLNVEELKAYAVLVAEENPQGIVAGPGEEDDDVEMEEVRIPGASQEGVEEEVDDMEDLVMRYVMTTGSMSMFH